MDKGTFSNWCSAATFGASFLLPRGQFQQIVQSVGLFAFSGGITNSLAVKMLFDRIPGLVGSGVIPARFREIRLKVKSLILEHFFDEAYLREFLSGSDTAIDWKRYVKPGNASPAGGLKGFVESQWESLSSPQVIQPIVDREVEKLMESSIGGLLLMVGTERVKPIVGQFVQAILGSLRPRVLEIAARAETSGGTVELDREKILEDVRATVDKLLTRKLEQLDAETVKRMMEQVIRDHLGWLVVWGNVFGAILGVVPVLVNRLYPR